VPWCGKHERRRKAIKEGRCARRPYDAVERNNGLLGVALGRGHRRYGRYGDVVMMGHEDCVFGVCFGVFVWPSIPGNAHSLVRGI
jgi:hypothetical protein